jgi:hypothetical protein
LYVNSPSAEWVTIYSLGGNVVFSAQKAAGEATLDAGHLPKGIYIARGDSGWVRKILIPN